MTSDQARQRAEKSFSRFRGRIPSSTSKSRRNVSPAARGAVRCQSWGVPFKEMSCGVLRDYWMIG
jgi:hypothetical protein